MPGKCLSGIVPEHCSSSVPRGRAPPTPGAKNRVRDASAFAARPRVENWWGTSRSPVAQALGGMRPWSARFRAPTEMPTTVTSLRPSQPAQPGQSDGELRRTEGPGAAGRCSGHIPAGRRQAIRLAGGEEGFLSESAARGHVPTVQRSIRQRRRDARCGTTDRVAVDGGRSGAGSLAIMDQDSAHRNTISRWVDRISEPSDTASKASEGIDRPGPHGSLLHGVIRELQPDQLGSYERAAARNSRSRAACAAASVAISPSRRRPSLSPITLLARFSVVAEPAEIPPADPDHAPTGSAVRRGADSSSGPQRVEPS